MRERDEESEKVYTTFVCFKSRNLIWLCWEWCSCNLYRNSVKCSYVSHVQYSRCFVRLMSWLLTCFFSRSLFLIARSKDLDSTSFLCLRAHHQHERCKYQLLFNTRASWWLPIHIHCFIHAVVPLLLIPKLHAHRTALTSVCRRCITRDVKEASCSPKAISAETSRYEKCSITVMDKWYIINSVCIVQLWTNCICEVYRSREEA